MSDTLAWIDAGRHFTADDLVFWQGRGQEDFASVAARIDTVVFGPHASAAFPAELRPHVDGALTRRKQHDFSDVITSPIGRAWAAADPHVVYVENPHSRLVMDPNRAPVADAGPGLRAFFAALARQRAGETVSFAGLDTIRPITFSGEPVLCEPRSQAEWQALVDVLNDCAARGPATYATIRDRLVHEVLAARPPGRHLHLISLHDTMNTQMRPDGAITRPRPPADRLPWLANFGNRGDAVGEGPVADITMPGAELRRIADAYANAWSIPDTERDAAILLNSPYKGAYETVTWGRRLRPLAQPNVGIVQMEFLRETLLGPAVTAMLQLPGADWPAVDQDHLASVVNRLKAAGDALRNAQA
jgi:hypothetical protein